MHNINQNQIKDFYNNIDKIWDENDAWHQYSNKAISHYLKSKRDVLKNTVILNAGSAGNSYGIACRQMFHVDIADKKIQGLENSVVASIENLPFENNSFDNIICVGSVLNYCDAVAAISELYRVLKDNGNLIIEFESSWGFEYLGQQVYKKEASIITTEYIEEKHTQWLYSHKYIYSILKSYDFQIIDKQTFHIIDGLLSKVFVDKMAVSLNFIDKIIKEIPLLNQHGNNVILHCLKKS
ncbi:methyltransferase domain-containing protein [Aminipila butyrica]|uniref:Methyltransferase domain-containing protein n=1 Tax=Aminipila butyrica TaxID=433296 RepID=A0A858BWM5_9FIRM|nr:class I SAM-dependent methyltransferase [Aminipila butyrica]QIB69508.1 methyltransferase domain-containing protein [Aminipila butyrica]